MLLRGLFRRCAWCGGKGSFFTSWYKKADHCQTCGINWERGYEGYELGAATMGVFITFGTIIMWLVLSVIIGVELVPLLLVAGVLAVFAHHHVSLDLHGVARGRPVYPGSVRGRPGEGRGLAG
jgi:uncharacterized protein (DUF983 family)